MARPIPAARFDQLLRTAAEVFIANGYRRTQMADVAEALGVAKGTVYLYVESKEALFDAVVRHIDDEQQIPCPPALPLSAPPAHATVEFARERILSQGRIEPLERALAAKTSPNVIAEIEEIVRAIFRVLHRNRRGIRLIDRSAVDRPDIAALWFEGGRGGLLALLETYVKSRSEAGLLRDVPDVSAAARAIVELLAFWAVHRHWDPHPQPIADEIAEDTVVAIVVRLLAAEGMKR
jgi:AcrR family transcriptional regulator